MRKINSVLFFLFVLGIIVVGAILIKNSKEGFSENDQGFFSQSINNYPSVEKQKIVTLNNGDSYDLTASIVKKVINGTEFKMLAYNGSIPGPLMKVAQGSEITLKFTNNTDVDSTIHSHGVRVENRFDGVPDVTQDPVKPGESFIYTIKFPDAGIYWYHPHIREDYAQELGLYGNFLVTPNTPDYWSEVDREEVLFLDDILIENQLSGIAGGQIAKFDTSIVDHTLMGRFGNTMLINGDDKYTLSVKQGERVRFYITNAANVRTFNIAIPNTRMKLVGSDNGKYEKEEWIKSVILGPSERQIVEIWFDKDGQYAIENQTPEKIYTLGIVDVKQNMITQNYPLMPRVNQDYIDSLNSLRPFFSKNTDKKLKISLDMLPPKQSFREEQVSDNVGNGMQHMMGDGMMMNHGMGMADIQKIEWEDDMGQMNALSTTDTLKWKLVDQETNKANMDIDWRFKKGEIVKIEVFNDETSMHPMQHPIHIHGQRFLVLSTNGAKNTNLVWKDTTLIQTGDTAELLVQMDNPGDWMIHCHIPEHMEAGMMMKYTVI